MSNFIHLELSSADDDATDQLAAARVAYQASAEITISRCTACALALFSNDRAWIMFLREDGDVGFSTRNPLVPDDSASLRFRLPNGQVDTYRASWTYSASEVFDALDHYLAHASFPDSIAWHNDSGDGASSPNA